MKNITNHNIIDTPRKNFHSFLSNAAKIIAPIPKIAAKPLLCAPRKNLIYLFSFYRLKIKLFYPNGKAYLYLIRLKEVKKKVAKRVNHKCQGYQCDKDYVRICKYCNKLFCKEHIKPKPFGMPPFKVDSSVADDYRKEINLPGGHSCIQYTHAWFEKLKEDDRKYMEALDKFLKSPSKSKEIYDYDDYDDSPLQEPNSPHRIRKLKSKPKKNYSALIVTILIIIAIGVISYFFILSDEDPFEPYNIKAQALWNNLNKARQEAGVRNFIVSDYLKTATEELTLLYAESNFIRESQRMEILRNNYINEDNPIFVSPKISHGYSTQDMVTRWVDLDQGKTILNPEYTKGAVTCYIDYCILLIERFNVMVNYK